MRSGEIWDLTPGSLAPESVLLTTISWASQRVDPHSSTVAEGAISKEETGGGSCPLNVLSKSGNAYYQGQKCLTEALVHIEKIELPSVCPDRVCRVG